MAFFDWLTGERPQVREASDDLQKMLRKGAEMFTASTGRLLDNEILEMDLELEDTEINALERHLRGVVRDCIGGGNEAERTSLLKLLGIVHEAERIGDLAKTISEVAGLATAPRLTPAVRPVRAVRDKIVLMFDATILSFRDHSVSAAEEVLAQHDAQKAEVRRQVALLAATDNMPANQAVVLALGTRMIGRVSSHLANIASAVAFPYEDLRRTHRLPEE